MSRRTPNDPMRPELDAIDLAYLVLLAILVPAFVVAAIFGSV